MEALAAFSDRLVLSLKVKPGATRDGVQARAAAAAAAAAEGPPQQPVPRDSPLLSLSTSLGVVRRRVRQLTEHLQRHGPDARKLRGRLSRPHGAAASAPAAARVVVLQRRSRASRGRGAEVGRRRWLPPTMSAGRADRDAVLLDIAHLLEAWCCGGPGGAVTRAGAARRARPSERGMRTRVEIPARDSSSCCSCSSYTAHPSSLATPWLWRS